MLSSFSIFSLFKSCSSLQMKYLKEEIQYLLNNNFIEPSQSEWSSPCILVQKPDGTYRMCTDYRKVNNLRKLDTFPIPRMDDCIDKIGNSKYITIFDLLKGFWQIPLTERAKEISAFVTPDGLYHYKVMPFGMKNSPATFQRLINTIVAGIEHCDAYIDDAIIYNDEWNHHLGTIKVFFDKLSEANLTINLAKSEFCHATLTFLGHVVGHGQVKPLEANVEAISNFPCPHAKDNWWGFLVWPVITENSVIICLSLLSHWLIYLVKEWGLSGLVIVRIPLINWKPYWEVSRFSWHRILIKNSS